MDLETLWYEAFPYLCGIGGLVSLFVGGPTPLLRISGVLLIAASLTILRLRWTWRREAFRRVPSVAATGKAGGPTAGAFDDEN